MTDEVNKPLFSIWKRIFELGDVKDINSLLSVKRYFTDEVDREDICSSLTDSNDVRELSDNQVKLTKITLKQLSLQQMLHHQCLIDDHYWDDIIERCHPLQSDTAEKILDVVKLVGDKIRCQYPMFNCHLVGGGSCSDGTKIDKLNEMDFTFFLKYNWNRDYNFIIEDDLFGNLKCVITPSVDSDLHNCCRDDGTLDVERFRADFKDALSHVVQDSCREMGITFGGCIKPYYSHFRHNGPSLTIYT